MNDAFCPAPWTSLYIGTTGNIDSCCISNNRLGIVGDDIESLITGKKNFEIKRSMLDGKTVPGCSVCDHPPEVKTLRRTYLDLFDDLPADSYHIDKFLLNYIDLRWRNTCNSACVYCGEEYSSLWAQEKNVAQRFDNTKIDSFKSFLEPRLTELNRVYLAGGEPLLIRENQWFLEKLLAVNPTCEIRVNTNLTAIDNPVFDLLTQFDRVLWMVSGETIGQKYEYIRYPSQWDIFQDNIGKLKQAVAHKEHSITFLMVYCALSAPYIADYIKFLCSKECYDGSINYYNQGVGGWCDPRHLSDRIKQQCQDSLQDLLSQDLNLSPNLIRTLRSVSVLLDTPHARDDELLKQELKRLDLSRDLDSRKIFPEIYQ